MFEILSVLGALILVLTSIGDYYTNSTLFSSSQPHIHRTENNYSNNKENNVVYSVSTSSSDSFDKTKYIIPLGYVLAVALQIPSILDQAGVI